MTKATSTRGTAMNAGKNEVSREWQQHIDGEISSIRADVSRVTAGQASLEAQVSSLGGAVSRLTDMVADLANRFTQVGKPNNTLIISAIGVAFTALAYIGSQWLDPVRSEIDRHEADITQMDVKAANLVDRLDTTIQREMRLLDATMESRIGSLDKTLQREMDLKDNLIDAKVEAVQAAADRNAQHLSGRDGMRFNMPDYERLVAPEIKDHDERLLSIESSRWPASEGMENRERIARLEAVVDSIRLQQNQRRPIIDAGIEASARNAAIIEKIKP